MNQDADAAEQLKKLAGPFVLRRLKTDRSVIADLPDKLEMNVFCNLTSEQASLYEAVVEEEFRATAEAFAAAGVASEVNTAGLRKPVGELYPDARLLELLCAAGVPLSLGSDAHVLEDVGRDFDRALVLAHGAGYRTVSRFRDREREQVPLG